MAPCRLRLASGQSRTSNERKTSGMKRTGKRGAVHERQQVRRGVRVCWVNWADNKIRAVILGLELLSLLAAIPLLGGLKQALHPDDITDSEGCDLAGGVALIIIPALLRLGTLNAVQSGLSHHLSAFHQIPEIAVGRTELLSDRLVSQPVRGRAVGTTIGELEGGEASGGVDRRTICIQHIGEVEIPVAMLSALDIVSEPTHQSAVDLLRHAVRLRVPGRGEGVPDVEKTVDLRNHLARESTAAIREHVLRAPVATNNLFHQELGHCGGVVLADGKGLNPLGEIIGEDENINATRRGRGEGTDDVNANPVPWPTNRNTAHLRLAVLANLVRRTRNTRDDIPSRVGEHARPPVGVGQPEIRLEDAKMAGENVVMSLPQHLRLLALRDDQ